MTAATMIFGVACAVVAGAAALAAEPAGAEHGAKVAFPPFDPSNFASQLLWLALTFGAFYLLMGRVIIPRIAGILEVRRDRISRDLDEAQRLKDESDAALAAYEHELAEARASAQQIVNKTNESMRAEAGEERAKLEAKLAVQLGQAEERIAAIRNRALGEVDRIASETVGTIVHELVGIDAGQGEIANAVAAIRGK